MYLKCPKMISKPVCRDGVSTSLLEQNYVQRRVSPLISSIGQDKTCSPDVAAVVGSQHQGPAFWSGSAPAPRSGYLDTTKNKVSVTSVTFMVYCWNQRGEEVKNLLISST
ncbi:hypothetical protein Y032_0015g2742 [Ancylostoma ceylanicum]|uniref:Uncharacterized protein n=1 Tax=Ancylostoma ceylanicum TaxID=53326 RepID=A0A016V7J1_9BILA|nr:hypothetical protein Y032_0015g2742 [Ancylostoma ceylanicum]